MIGIVGCSAQKLMHAAPARELYTSPLFKLSLRYALDHCDRVYVLSARSLGLIELEDRLDTYDVTLRRLSPAARADWARSVARDLFKRHATDLRDQTLCVLAGAEYVDPVVAAYRSAGYGPLDVIEPLRGMQIGERLAFLGAQVRKAA